jgi:hypothetical protein
MADPALVISLAAEFVGKPAFKQADTATQKLSKGVKSLAKTIGVAFSVTAVLAYGKAAVKAAAADEKAQKQLGLALKNVGLGRDAASSEEYIQKLQSEFGIVDDKLRPAYQTLAVATRSSTEAQRLLNLALDISASTGKDLGSVTGALSKAFLGNNTALGKLGVGISKADLKAKSFQEITDELAVTFKGSATAAANTFQGSMDKLAVSSANVQEIIGKGLIDAFKMLGDDGSVDNLAIQMESVAIYIADSIRGIGVLVGYIQSASDAAAKIPFLSQITDSLLKLSPLFGGIVGLNALGSKAAADAARTGDTAQALAHLAELESRYANVTLATKKKITAEEAKQLKDKKLKLAIDKANLALGKGSDVFDMEKIQLAAAERNAAEQLGKITSQAQLLQITNDLARLEVKKSILALEDAIKTNDVAAITNATAKLNADLMILGALTGQKVKLTDIKDILQSIVPKDLINLANLDAAIAKLLMIASFGNPNGPGSGSPILGDPNASPKGYPGAAGINAALAAGSFVPVVGGGGYSSTAGNYASSGFPGAQKNGDIYVTVNAGAIADPDGLVTLVKTAIQDLNRAGDSTTFAGAIA